MNTDVMFSSKTDLWETPQEFLTNLTMNFTLHWTRRLRKITQNVAIILLQNRMDFHKNGPVQYFATPPYCRQTGKWVKKAYEESQLGNCTVVMLLPCRPDVSWFHDYILGKAEIRFVRGRLKFGGSKNSAPFPSMVVIFRPDRAAVREET